MVQKKKPSRGRNYPFAQRGSAFLERCHVSFDEAVSMFYDQTAMQQHLGHDPIVNSLVYKGVKYPTILDAQRAYTQDQNAFYQKKEQEQLALEARGIKAFKNMNDAIRNRLNPTENGLMNVAERPLKPMGEGASMSTLNDLLSKAQSSLGAESEPTAKNLTASSNLTESKPTATLDPNNAYWPPYNPLAKEGEKELDVIYQKKITSIAVLSLEESYEFLQTLYHKHGERHLSDDFKTYIVGVGKGSYDAFKNAKGLGGYGVQATVKTIDGVDWVIIRNFRFHQQTLMAGYKWKANNPQVIKMALGLKALGSVKNLVRVNVGLEIAFAVGINAVDYILKDEATLAEFVGNSAYDIVKGVTSLVASVSITALILGVASVSVLGGGLIFVIVSYVIGQAVSSTFDNVKEFMEDYATKEAEDYIERINGYSFSMSDALRKAAL